MIPLEVFTYFAIFGAVACFVWFGIQLFGKGWQSYEEKYVKGAERSLDAMYLTMPAQHIFYLMLVSMIVVGAAVWAAFGNLPFGVFMGLIALFLPNFVIWLLKRRREKLFGVQLIDALVGMGNALRAGFSLPMSLELLAREMPNPMGQEMRMVTQEMRIGVTTEDALRHLAQRMPSEDLNLLITCITITREVGGNLSEIFDNIADTIRERHRIQGKIESLTAQGKLQGIIVALLPVAIGVALTLINPGLMAPMFHSYAGWLMLSVIVIMEAIGVYIIWRLTIIDV